MIVSRHKPLYAKQFTAEHPLKQEIPQGEVIKGYCAKITILQQIQLK